MGYMVMCSIPYFTNIPEDVVTNTFHFSHSGTVGPSDFTALKNTVANFYETVWPSGSAGCQAAAWLNPSQTRIKIYNLDDPIPRVPVLDAITPISIRQETSGTAAPEVALCLSLKADPISGINPRNQRGRLFLGGIGSSSITNGTASSFPKPDGVLIGNLILAAQGIITNQVTTGWSWNIYSPTVGLAFPVTGGFVDNAFDTQRRRGNKATGRTVWT